MRQMILRSHIRLLLVITGLLALAADAVMQPGLFSHAATAPPAAASAGLRQRTGGDTERLIATLQTRLRTVPDDAQAYVQLGLAYLQRVRETGDPVYYPKAEGVLQRALELQPDNYLATGGRGALALARHQFAQALVWGEHARELDPRRTYAYGVIADAQSELGRYEEAVTTLQTWVELRPDANAYARVAWLRELHGDIPGAAEMLQRAIVGVGPNAEHHAWLLTQLGQLRFNHGALLQAEEEYRRALAVLPEYAPALAGLARVRFAQGDNGQAEQLLTQAVQILPLPEFAIMLGELCAAAGRSEQARHHYELVRVMQRLYQANGVNLDLELALFAADHGDAPQAVAQQARAAYAQRPSIQAADMLAWALYRAGEFDEARRYAGQALRLGTQDSLLFFHAGMIFRQSGDTARARYYLERALALNPHFSIRFAMEARRTLEELQTVALAADH